MSKIKHQFVFEESILNTDVISAKVSEIIIPTESLIITDAIKDNSINAINSIKDHAIDTINSAKSDIITADETITIKSIVTPNIESVITYSIDYSCSIKDITINSGTILSIELDNSNVSPPIVANQQNNLKIRFISQSNPAIINIIRKLIPLNKQLNILPSNSKFPLTVGGVLFTVYCNNINDYLSVGSQLSYTMLPIFKGNQLYYWSSSYTVSGSYFQYRPLYVHDLNSIYIILSQSVLVAFNVLTRQLSSAISLSGARDIIYNKQNNLIYIANNQSNFVEINPYSWSIIRTVQYDTTAAVQCIELMNNRYVYLCAIENTTLGRVLCYDLHTSSWIANISIPTASGAYPAFMRYHANTMRLFIFYRTGAVRVIDANPLSATYHQIIASFGNYTTYCAAIGNNYIYFYVVSSNNGYIIKLNPTTYQVINQYLVGRSANDKSYLYIDPFGNVIYGGNRIDPIIIDNESIY